MPFRKEHLQLVTDAGATLDIGWDYGTPYSLDPINGVDVDVQTAQGVNQVGVSVEIPLFDRRQGPIERAKVEADQAELRRDAVVLAAQSELQRALQQLSLRRTAVRDYEKEGLAQIAPLHQMAQDAYKLGKGTILELIDALGSITEHRLEHLELVKDMLDAEWEVRQASGDLPQVQP